MINNFLKYLQYEKNYSSHTVLSYKIDLNQFCDFLNIAPNKIAPNKIDSQDISQWILHLMNNGISARTVSRKISTLKSFWRYLLINNIVLKNPTKKIILPKTNKPLPAFYKESEVESVLVEDKSNKKTDFENVRDKLIISLLYQLGLRVSELISLTEKNIDFSSKEISVIGKRNKERKIPIGENLKNEISFYIKLKSAEIESSTNNLLVTKKGKQMYSRGIYNIVKRMMTSKSTLHKQSPHVLRHTFATTLLNNGANLNAVKDLMGHSSLAATQIYTHVNFKELNKIYNHAHPRAKKS